MNIRLMAFEKSPHQSIQKLYHDCFAHQLTVQIQHPTQFCGHMRRYRSSPHMPVIIDNGLTDVGRLQPIYLAIFALQVADIRRGIHPFARHTACQLIGGEFAPVLMNMAL